MTPEIILTAVTRNGWSLRYVPDHLKTYEIVLVAVTQHGYALQWVPDHLQTPEIAFAAVTEYYGGALKYVKTMTIPLLLKINISRIII